jgi:hypothetical protein
VLGAILTGIDLSGAYQYYSYYQDYAATDEEPVGKLGDGRASGTNVPAVME